MTKRSKRPTRKPLSKRGPLIAEQRTGYVRRWVNLEGNNYEDRLALGYQPVQNESKRKDTKTVGDDPLASVVTKVVNRKDGTRAVLMELPEDLYEEYRAESQRIVDEIEEAMEPENSSTHYGSMTKKVIK